MRICPLFSAFDLHMTPPLDPAKDPIEKHITWGVSISLKLLQKVISIRNKTLSWTADSFCKKALLMPLRITIISLLSVRVLSVSILQVAETAARIAFLTLSIPLLAALLCDAYNQDPYFTNPIAQIPAQIGYTIPINASSLLASLYTAKEMLFSEKTVVLSEVLDTASFGFLPKAVNWAYNTS